MNECVPCIAGSTVDPAHFGSLTGGWNMLKTDAAGRHETDSLDTPEALRALAVKAKRFAASLPNENARRRIVESAVRLEAEAAMLEKLRQG
jgi:hypothetical protein